MSNYPELYILRHGQTEWNVEGRMQGNLDSPLTPKGRDQAKTQGRLLRSLGLEAVPYPCLSSPKGRAFETASIALSEISCVPVVDARLCETDLGSWQNCLLRDLRPNCPADLWQDLGPSWYFFNAPDGESFESQRDRCKSLLDGLHGPAILVTHGITSRVLRGLWLGLGYRDTVLLPDGQGGVFHMKNEGQWLCSPQNPTGEAC